MKNLLLLRIYVFVFLLLQAISIDIKLTSILTDTTTDSYEIAKNVLSIKSKGEYKISGSCSECQISIAKGLTVAVTLDSISIDNSNTGPFVIKKNAIVNLILEGESRIEDNEASENEELDDFEGAGIKFKNSSSLTISGSGKLTVVGNPKNGIKGAALTTLIINGGTLDISAAKNALAGDNIIEINDGIIIINSQSDGIKAEPDSDDPDSKGMITINGGNITINSKSDAIQAAYKLVVNGGNFNIKTLDGANTLNFDKDTDSAKGLKCSTNEHENVENIITINGGNFILDTADDSIHSDFNLTINGGTFDISSGDDGVHADQYLILGKQKADNNLINLKVKKSLEGLEGAYVYIYSGTYNVTSSDDGINSAGDTTENCEANQGGPRNNNNNRNQPQRNLRGRVLQGQSSQCNNFHMYIYGGDIYVNAGADGLDSNGNIIISGANVEIWGARSGSDGDPIDTNGKLTISDSTVLAGGNQGMNPLHQGTEITQQYIYTSQAFNANKQISINNGNSVVRTITIPKNVGYIFYTSKDTTSNYQFSVGQTNSNQNNNFPPNAPGSDNNFPSNPAGSDNHTFPPNPPGSDKNNIPPNPPGSDNNNIPPSPPGSDNNNIPPNPPGSDNNNIPPNPPGSDNSFPPNPPGSDNHNFPPNPPGSDNNNIPPNPPGSDNNNIPPNPPGSDNNNIPPNPPGSDNNNIPPNPPGSDNNNIPPNPPGSDNNNIPPNPPGSDNNNQNPPDSNINQTTKDEDFILLNLSGYLNIDLLLLLFAFVY